MNKLKCPFCQQELFYTYQQDGMVPNPHKGKVDGVFCDNCKMYGNETIWERLDRTRKALDVAVDALKDNLSQANFREMLDASRFHCIRTKCESALAEITALEQKE